MAIETSGRVRVAVGGCGPSPIRDRKAEERLAGRTGDRAAVLGFGRGLVAMADPLSDVRGSAEYRLTLIPRIVAATIAELTAQRELAA